MRYIEIDKVSSGMVLAKTIYDENGRILLGHRSVLTDEFIEKLKKRGLPGVYVEDELTKDIEIQETITAELRNRGVDALRRRNIDETMRVAHKIVEQILDSAVVSLDMIDLRTFDDYTYRHSVNVAVLSTVIGMNMNLNKTYINELAASAILHDIGKIFIDPKILNKPGALTDEEYNEVKKHPIIGYDMLKKRVDISARIRSGILSHHENEDGSGYPNQLKYNQIFQYAKIIHVADVFDALTSKRPYKEAHSRAEAVEYLMASGGTLFDIDIVRKFLESVAVYPVGTTVTLSTGEEAVVVHNSDHILRPRVRLMSGREIDLANPKKYRNITIVNKEEKEHNL